MVRIKVCICLSLLFSFQDVNLETFESILSDDGITTVKADVKSAEKADEKKIEIKLKEDNKEK